MSHLDYCPTSTPLFFMYYFLVLMPFTLIHLFSFSRDPAQNQKGEHASEMLTFMHSASHSAVESTPDIF